MVPGTMLAARYRIERRIGRGGMGEVWAGVDTVLGREVAVKTVDLIAVEDPAVEERFRREAKATASLSHENIVSIFDFGTDGSIAFLVMELLPGRSLAKVVADEGPLPVTDALEIAQQVAGALDSAHRVGVVHRDIKPSNLMLDARDRVKVVDFGIARLIESAATQLTATATAIGSAPYMAPEQAAGQPASPATDLYALGCVLMALLTGQPPFTGEHPLAVAQQQLTAQPPRVSDRRPEVPPEVDDLVDQLLAKAPEDRPAGAELVRTRIARISGAEALSSTAPTSATRSLPVTRTSGPVGGPLPGSSPRPGRRRRLLWFTGAAMAALIVGFLAFGPDGSRTNPSADAKSSRPTESQAPPSTPTKPATTRSGATPTRTPSERRTQPLSRREAVNGLRRAVGSAATSGQLEEKAQQDLEHRVDDLTKRLDEGKVADFDHKLEEFSHRLDDLSREGKLTAAGEARIRKALQRVH